MRARLAQVTFILGIIYGIVSALTRSSRNSKKLKTAHHFISERNAATLWKFIYKRCEILELVKSQHAFQVIGLFRS